AVDAGGIAALEVEAEIAEIGAGLETCIGEGALLILDIADGGEAAEEGAAIACREMPGKAGVIVDAAFAAVDDAAALRPQIDLAAKAGREGMGEARRAA